MRHTAFSRSTVRAPGGGGDGHSGQCFSGLSGAGRVLRSNGSDSPSVAAAGTFSFPVRVAAGASVRRALRDTEACVL